MTDTTWAVQDSFGITVHRDKMKLVRIARVKGTVLQLEDGTVFDRATLTHVIDAYDGIVLKSAEDLQVAADMWTYIVGQKSRELRRAVKKLEDWYSPKTSKKVEKALQGLSYAVGRNIDAHTKLEESEANTVKPTVHTMVDEYLERTAHS